MEKNNKFKNPPKNTVAVKMNTPMYNLKQKVLDERFEAHIAGNKEYKNALNFVIVAIEKSIKEERTEIISAFEHGLEVKRTKLNTGENYYNSKEI